MSEEHQAPWECVYAKEDKSTCKPGKKPDSDKEYFEVLCLCILQAGLNWGVIRKNWPKYREGFYDFDIDKLSRAQTEELIKGPNVIRNSKKVEAIICNAQEFQRISKEYGSFSSFLGSVRQMPDEELFQSLMKRFRHVGSYTAEYFLHCVGYWS